MGKLKRRVRLVLTAMLLLAAAVPVAAQTAAQAPAPLDANTAAVTEQRLLQRHYLIEGRGTIADTRSYVIEQPLGRLWRMAQSVWLRWIGAAVIIATLAFFTVLYFTLGPMRIEAGRSGRMIVRFSAFERCLHWTIAISFTILAVTGLNITFGRELLLPLIGAEAFSRWSLLSKYAHDYSSFPFLLCVAVMFLLWARATLPTMVDVRWFMEGGGMVGHRHPPAEKFNGGQKLLFWVAMAGTAGVALSGVFLLFPFYWSNIIGMQIAHVAHALVGLAFVATVIAHIYIGAVGLEGGWAAMVSGEVDLNWAKQHHSLWVEREFGQGRGANPPAGATTTSP